MRDDEKIEELEAELVEWISTYFFDNSFYKDGRYDSMALTSVMEAGDRLVELGVLTKDPEGFGRRWFYKKVDT